MSFEQSIDRCVRCGFCLPACPTYQLFNREESSPRGRIALMAALQAGEVEAGPVTLATYEECLGCRACESACPSGVIYEEVLLAGRERLREVSAPLPLYIRFLLATLCLPATLTLARLSWRYLGSVLSRPASHIHTRRQPWALLSVVPPPRTHTVPPASGRLEVAVHRGCLMDIFWEGTNARAVTLLREAGYQTDRLPVTAGCCGALHAHSGDIGTARTLAKQVIEAFEASGAQVAVNLAGGCAAHLAGYGDLFPPGDPWHERAQRVASGVRDVASLLSEQQWQSDGSDERVTYAESCHLRHGMKVWRAPRELLEEISCYRELPRADTCCGSAGIYNLVRPDVAGEVLDGKIRDLESIDVTTLVVSNPGCELQWRLGIHLARLPVRVRHLVDYLYDAREQLPG